MTAFLIGIAFLVVAWLFAQWYVNANPSTLRVALKWIVIVLAVLVMVGFAVTGKVLWLFMMLPVILTLFLRARSAVRSAKNFARMAQAATGGQAAGQTSEVKTRFLHMTLDHGTGEMTGIVMEGPYQGWPLDDLTFEQTIAFWRLCRSEDQESTQVLEAYMDRLRPDWREVVGEAGTDEQGPQGESRGHETSGMTRAQALAVLGLEEGASREAIKEAYQRIISGLHPDRGGSDFLAAQVNEAKSILLGE